LRDGRDGDTYHISTARVISIRDLVQQICDRLGVRFDEHVEVVGERLGKDSAYHLDSAKLRAELDWQDRITLEDGIEECIAWVRSNLETLRREPFDYVHKP